ncbi:MAG: hypothetical protein HY714_05025 [Candidatus Omnitrophica bacterium]|nr:hypothetical protein [Candidatus Omnitrophota bacterium]
MNRRFAAVIFLVWLALGAGGCALFLVGAGAAGGYAISKDEIEGYTDQDYDRAWESARRVIANDGAILSENKTLGEIEATVRDSDVKAKIEKISSVSVRMRIQARKGYNLLPDLETAQDLYTKIIKDLK